MANDGSISGLLIPFIPVFKKQLARYKFLTGNNNEDTIINYHKYIIPEFEKIGAQTSSAEDMRNVVVNSPVSRGNFNTKLRTPSNSFDAQTFGDITNDVLSFISEVYDKVKDGQTSSPEAQEIAVVANQDQNYQSGSAEPENDDTPQPESTEKKGFFQEWGKQIIIGLIIIWAGKKFL